MKPLKPKPLKPKTSRLVKSWTTAGGVNYCRYYANIPISFIRALKWKKGDYLSFHAEAEGLLIKKTLKPKPLKPNRHD
jgi:hypothetical protein